MRKVAFVTLGCKVNQYDTQVMIEAMKKAGYEVVDIEQIADIYIINTCTVTSMSDRKSRQMIRKLALFNPNSSIIVTGCYAERQADKIKSLNNVSMVLSNKEKPFIDRFVNEFLKISNQAYFETGNFYPCITEFDGQTRAFVKIEDGCDSFCTYCIVPYVRGSTIRSRPVESIIHEVKALSENGYKEIVLTGIHLGAYGKENPNGPKLSDVIGLVHEINGIERIRLSSIEPMDVNDELINKISRLHKCAHHLHISLQSGSDKILRLMRRGYNSQNFEHVIAKIRDILPDVGISTDIMVGFPGESETDFLETYTLIERIKFSRLHVFRYSPREGTPAEKYKNRVSDSISTQRSHRIISLGNLLLRESHFKMVGKYSDVLIEDIREGKDNLLAGFTSNYARVLVENAKEEHIGQILQVKLVNIKDNNLIGSIVHD